MKYKLESVLDVLGVEGMEDVCEILVAVREYCEAQDYDFYTVLQDSYQEYLERKKE